MSRLRKAILLTAMVAAPFTRLEAAPRQPQQPTAAEARSGGMPAQLAAACRGREGWSDPAPPARIFGNTWYVGTCGISAILIAGDPAKGGHILLDGGIAKAAPLVLASIRKAGFNPREVRWIIASHEHHDHVGALAALKRATGAQVAALPAQAAVLESGQPNADDPQSAGMDPIAPVAVERSLHDGEALTLGSLRVTAHATPVHAPGSTSWTWRSCEAGRGCLNMVYADSASTISSAGYRFTDHPTRVAAVRAGLPRIAALPCDLLLTPHPQASAMMERSAGAKPLIDAKGCRVYVADARKRFADRLTQETSHGGTELRK